MPCRYEVAATYADNKKKKKNFFVFNRLKENDFLTPQTLTSFFIFSLLSLPPLPHIFPNHTSNSINLYLLHPFVKILQEPYIVRSCPGCYAITPSNFLSRRRLILVFCSYIQDAFTMDYIVLRFGKEAREDDWMRSTGLGVGRNPIGCNQKV